MLYDFLTLFCLLSWIAAIIWIAGDTAGMYGRWPWHGEDYVIYGITFVFAPLILGCALAYWLEDKLEVLIYHGCRICISLVRWVI